MIRAVAFDCLGVLVLDSYQQLQQSFPTYQNELIELEKCLKFGFINEQEYIQEVSYIIKKNKHKTSNLLKFKYSINLQLIEFIKTIKVSGCKVGMISNIDRGWLKKTVPSRVLQLFETIVISGDVKLYKPQPEIFKLTLNKLKVLPSEMLFIDDSNENIISADNLGIHTIHFTNNKQLKSGLNAYEFTA